MKKIPAKKNTTKEPSTTTTRTPARQNMKISGNRTGPFIVGTRASAGGLEALRESEEQYRNLFQNAIEGILVADVDTKKFLHVNPAICRMLGYTEEELTSMGITDIHPEKELNYIVKEFGAIMQGDKHFSDTIPCLRKDGSILYADISGFPQMINGKKYNIGFFTDATERKRAEETLRDFNKKLQQGIEEQTAILRESELRHLMLFESSRDAIMTLEPPDWRFTSGNPATIAMFLAKDEAEFTSAAPWNLSPEFQPDGRPSGEKAKEMIENAVREGSHYFEWTHKRLNGEDFPATVLLTRFEWKGKEILQATVRDITERKHAEDKIKASLDEKVLLLREIHHRVKNNLQIIISLLNLQIRQADDERLKQIMAETRNRVMAMSLVHDKLYQSEDISKINLDDYVRFLGNSLFQFYGMKGKGIVLNTQIQDINVDINTAIPVGLIVNELVSNSLKHAFPKGRKGEISVTITRENAMLTMVYKDTGVGIPPDLDWRTAKSLGLRLVVSLVEQLFGTIELDRSAGTAFTIVVKEKE